MANEVPFLFQEPCGMTNEVPLLLQEPYDKRGTLPPSGAVWYDK